MPACRRMRGAGRTPPSVNTMEGRIKVEQHSVSGAAWFAGWLFTIGYLHLTFWKAVLAIVLWPYYLGVTFRVLAH